LKAVTRTDGEEVVGAKHFGWTFLRGAARHGATNSLSNATCSSFAMRASRIVVLRPTIAQSVAALPEGKRASRLRPRALFSLTCCSVSSRPGSSRRAFPQRSTSCPPATYGCMKSSTMASGLSHARMATACGSTAAPAMTSHAASRLSSRRSFVCARGHAPSTGKPFRAVRMGLRHCNK
jgi:hypothetical protein